MELAKTVLADIAIAWVGVIATLAGFAIVSLAQGAPTAQDNARTFDVLRAEGVPDHDLCLQARQTMASFSGEGNAIELKRWSQKAQEACRGITAE